MSTHAVGAGADTSHSQMYKYKSYLPTAYLVIESHNTVNNTVNNPHTHTAIAISTACGMNIYFQDTPAPDDLPHVNIMYDYTQVNHQIMTRALPVPDPTTERLGEALYSNHIYQLFLIEFINYLGAERNNILRKKLYSAAEGLGKDYGKFSKELEGLLKDHPGDLAKIQSQLTFHRPEHGKFVTQLENTVYDFDRTTFSRLRAMPRPEMIRELHKICAEFTIHKSIDTTKIQFSNIYISCREGESICKGKKLIIDRDLTAMIDILATDIMNRLKGIHIFDIDNTIDYFAFEKIPTEIITIYRLNM
jgi:hypothetical protein